MKAFFIFLLIFPAIMFGQTGVNQYDSLNRKDGKWTRYLDSTWKTVTDAQQAKYMKYVYYDHGEDVMMEIYYSQKKRLEIIGGNNLKTNKGITILDGEYKWYNKNDRLLSHEKYENGEIVWCYSYMWGIMGNKLTGKKLHEYFDHTKKCEGQPYSFYSEHYNRKGEKTTYYLSKGKNGYSYYPAGE